MARRERARVRAALALALALVVAPASGAARADALVPVTGVVLDRAGNPVEYATIACPSHRTGTAADEHGRFTLELPPGPTRLEIAQLGYERVRIEVRVGPGLAPLRVTLGDEPLELAEVQVGTSSFGKAGTGEGATLRRMDVLTTPGGAADVMQSLRALPGINAPNEGAAVYVRGGDPSETLIRMDGLEVGHPYHYEGASGGLFSALDAYLVKGAFFSSGGFGARYGGVLSGVLDVDTNDPGDAGGANLGVNMVGANLSATVPLVPGRLGAIGSLRYSDTDVLMRVYGSSRDYESAPVSHDAAGKLVWRHSAAGRITLTGIANGDRTAVDANVLNVASTYREHARNRLLALELSDAAGAGFAYHVRGAYQRYTNDWTYAGFGTSRDETGLQASLEASWAVHPRHALTFGANAPRRAVHLAGRLPADSVDLESGAPLRALDHRPVIATPGVFLEDKLRLAGPFYATLGARADWISNVRRWTFDPRAALAWRVDDAHTLRVAAGRYHQAADPERLDPARGNPRLGPARADHVIAGWEWLEGDNDVRLEAYRKEYRGLATDDPVTYHTDGGHGYARGVDLFVRGARRFVSGWVSYGYLDSKRKEGDDPRQLPAEHGVRHALSLVGSYRWSGAWILGTRWGWSSGRAWTPVADRAWDGTRGIWRPVFAENHSGTMPAYSRLDVRATRLFNLPKGLGLPTSAPCAAYLEGLNVLGTRNVLEYVYNSDYSQRYARDSYFSRRFLVAGVSLSW